jgi:hypothetical protein
MPGVTVSMVRAALLWQGLGFSLGGLLLLAKGAQAFPWIWALRSAHIHMLLMGWLVQLAVGVAYWILPRFDAAGSRGDPRTIWLAVAALNLGVALAAVATPLGLAPLMLAAGLLYALAGVLFIAKLWPRVLALRTPPRPSA